MNKLKRLWYRRKYFDIITSRNYGHDFIIGGNIIWIHRHSEDDYFHYHLLLDLGWWFIEVRIGKEGEKKI